MDHVFTAATVLGLMLISPPLIRVTELVIFRVQRRRRRRRTLTRV